MSNYIGCLFLIVLPCLGLSQTENYWTKKSDFAGLKRERAVAFSIGDFGYVGTGLDTAEIVHNDLWKYDPTLDSWTQMANLPGSVRRNAVGFSVGNMGYIGTGIDSAEAQIPGATVLNDFWQYNPSSNSWVQKADFPGFGNSGVYFATGFGIDSKGYICGGKNGPNSYSDELWEYKPATDQWAQLGDFPGGIRYQLSSFTIGYKAYVGLGTDQDLFNNDFWEFSTATNSWSQIENLPSSERSASMTFTIGQRGYVCMGNNGGLLDDLWEYNPSDDDWTPRANYGGSERKGGIAFSINGKGYVGIGKGYSGKKSSFYEYTPPSFLSLDQSEMDFDIFPNPSSEWISINTQSEKIVRFEILNYTGNRIQSIIKAKKINIEKLNSGNYILVAYDNHNNILSQQKFIKI